MINLYHGSNVEIREIDLSLSKKGKDFGQGFYLNPNFKQAKEMADKVTELRECGKAVVSVFEFDENLIESSNLKVKFFEDYTEEWAEFVLENRKNKSAGSVHNYDIVVGPIADDTVGVQLRRYILGYISIQKLVEELRFRGSKAVQFFFGTEKSIKHLKLTGYE